MTDSVCMARPPQARDPAGDHKCEGNGVYCDRCWAEIEKLPVTIGGTVSTTGAENDHQVPRQMHGRGRTA